MRFTAIISALSALTILGCGQETDGPVWPNDNPYQGEEGIADGWEYLEWLAAAYCCDPDGSASGSPGAWEAYGDRITAQDCIGDKKFQFLTASLGDVFAYHSEDAYCVDAELADACVEWLAENIDESCSSGVPDECDMWTVWLSCIEEPY